MCKAEDMKHMGNSCCFCSAHHCPSQSMPTKNILKFTRCPPSPYHRWCSTYRVHTQPEWGEDAGRRAGREGGSAAGSNAHGHVRQGDATPSDCLHANIFALPKLPSVTRKIIMMGVARGRERPGERGARTGDQS